MRPLLLATFLVFVLPATATADFVPAPGSPFAAGGQPFAVATADFNGDGRRDVAVANEATDNVTILLRQAGGGYAPEAGSPVAAGDGPVSVIAEDFNGDTRPDLAVANFRSDSITILLRQAGGGFAPEAGSPIATGSLPSSVASGDFDLDNRPDLAVTNQNAGTVTILLRQPGGGFAAEAGSPFAVGTYPHEVVVAQFDGNFGPDLAVTNQGSGDVSILLRQPGAGFAQEAGSPIAVGATPLGIVAGDFNGDDGNDLAVANWGSDSITVLRRQPLGGFAQELGSPLTTGDQPYGLAAADFDRDGRLDLAVSQGDSIGIHVRGAAGFSEGFGSPAGGVSLGLRLAAADLDGDTRPDLAIPNYGAASVSVLRNVRGTRITAGPDGLTNDATPAFAFESDDPVATFECGLDGGAFEACASPHTTVELPDGAHEFAVRAVGDPTPATRGFTVDTVPPDTTITSGPAGVVTAVPSYGFESSEPGARFECRVGGGAFMSCASPAAAAVAAPGAYEFQVRAIDAAGNVDPTPAARAFELRAAGEAPRNLRRPEIKSGSVPRLYTCDPGLWQGADGLEYRWWRAYSFGSHVLVGNSAGYRVPSQFVGFTFYCAVTARNAHGSSTAVSNWTILSGLVDVPPVFAGIAYGNVAVRGIDLFQTVQPNSGAQMYGFPAGAFPTVPGGGTPTGGRRVAYSGVTLDADKPTTAVVYVNMTAAAATSASAPLDVTLRVLRNGVRIRTLTRTITNPAVSALPAVSAAERENPGFGVQFPLPPSLAGTGELDFEAEVGFPVAELLRNRRECDAAGCEADNRFRVDGVPLVRLPSLTVIAVELLGRGQTSLKDGATVLSRARQLFPGGDHMMVPTVARLDVGDETNYSFADHQCEDDIDVDDVRGCRQHYITERALSWRTDDPVAKGLGPYQAMLGIHEYMVNERDGTNFTEPGWTSGDVDLSTFNPKAGGSPLFFANAGSLNRPLTAAAHELGHVFSAPHAERDTNPDPNVNTDCGGDSRGQVGEAWPPDQMGRLQGVRFDHAAAGKKVTVDGVSANLFDLMSYCGPESGAWLSARNWNRALKVLQDLGARMAARTLAAARQDSATMGFAVGVLGRSGGRITRFVPPDGADRIPASVPGSPVRLRALDPNGAVIGESGATVLRSTELGGGGAFVAPVPANAAAVELWRDGAVVSTLRRSAAPRVRLLAPARGARVRSLVVRWTSSDPDGGARRAGVDYSADGGRTWRTVSDGPDRGRAALPASLVSGSDRARVRVTVSDGFGETRAVSGVFRAAGTPPQVRIVSAQAGAAGEPMRLVGMALDDRQRPLRGRALVWYAGARHLGTGERLTVRLPAGRVKLRLVAGRGQARRTLRIAPAPLRLLAVTAPARVAGGASHIDVRIRVSARATLVAGDRSYRVGPRVARVAIRLPRRPATGVLTIPFRVGPIRSAITVVRA